MACESKLGVKNIMLTFTDCDTGYTTGPVAHTLSNDDNLPTGDFCGYKNTELNDGRVKVARKSKQINITVQPDPSIPTSYYTGCATIDIQVEWLDGRVWTAKNSNPVDSNPISGESAELNLRFKEGDEMLLAQAA